MADTILEQSSMIETKIEELFPGIKFELVLRQTNGYDELVISFCTNECVCETLHNFHDWLVADQGLKTQTIGAEIRENCPSGKRPPHIHGVLTLIDD